ncbi:hypothetical protein FJZ18_00750 [Candidatus Pacearchaeota archaeon]|nr:hypothetical protein [Candidatus Pacearchaeota archaeon]
MRKTLAQLLSASLLAGAFIATSCNFYPPYQKRSTILTRVSPQEQSKLVDSSPIGPDSGKPEYEPFFTSLSLAGILDLLPPLTIGHAVLRMEQGVGATAEDKHTLDKILDKAREKIPYKEKYTLQDATNSLQIIHGILEENGFKSEACVLLNTGLRNHKLDCDLRSYIYLSIAENREFPLKAVYLPGHMFVRWHDDDGTIINWETTAGATLPSSYYLNELKDQWKKNYPESKDEDWKFIVYNHEQLVEQAAHIVYTEVARKYTPDAPKPGELKSFKSQITPEQYLFEGAPVFSVAADYLSWKRLGASMTSARFYEMAYRWDEAISEYTEIIQKDPHNADAYVNRANIYSMKSQSAESFEGKSFFLKLGNQDLDIAKKLLGK